jgi:hypothetical protein
MSASNPPPVTTSPAVTAATTADVIAEQFRAVLVTLLPIVPDLQKFDSKKVKRIAASAKFGNDAIVPVINLVASVPRVRDLNLFDVDAGHFARQFQDQVVPLAKQLIEFANDVVFTGQNLLSASSVQGLQVYRLAQHVVKQPDGADLQPFVDTMSHIVKKTMNRRKKPAPAPPPTPSTTTTPHTPSTPGAQAFLASNLVPGKTGEPEDVADRFEQALKEVNK